MSEPNRIYKLSAPHGCLIHNFNYIQIETVSFLVVVDWWESDHHVFLSLICIFFTQVDIFIWHCRILCTWRCTQHFISPALDLYFYLWQVSFQSFGRPIRHCDPLGLNQPRSYFRYGLMCSGIIALFACDFWFAFFFASYPFILWSFLYSRSAGT